MSNIETLLANHRAVKKAISDYFGQPWMSYEIEDLTDPFWYYKNGNIYMTDELVSIDEIFDDPLYSEEASLIERMEDCSLFLISSCTGDKYYGIFNNSKEIKE